MYIHMYMCSDPIVWGRPELVDKEVCEWATQLYSKPVESRMLVVVTYLYFRVVAMAICWTSAHTPGAAGSERSDIAKTCV